MILDTLEHSPLCGGSSLLFFHHELFRQGTLKSKNVYKAFYDGIGNVERNTQGWTMIAQQDAGGLGRAWDAYSPTCFFTTKEFLYVVSHRDTEPHWLSNLPKQEAGTARWQPQLFLGKEGGTQLED